MDAFTQWVSKVQEEGGPAFPVRTEDESTGSKYTSLGMTLRDWFAGQALIGLIAKGHNIDANVKDAYYYADAMLAARKTKED